ncbi:hypothetical protein KKF19_03740 [Patescibacteria group bacterium]|nr:hypothetical protein [Patescibacteria group bacterium]
MDKKIVREKLDLIRGEIISSTTRVEFVLGYRLRKYFFPKSNNKATILFWNVVNTPYLTFDNKISIYESIPYFQKLKGYLAIKKSLRFVQRLRNIMAHWDLDEKKSDLQNIFMFTLVGKYKRITINDNLVENYRKQINFLLKEFGYSR